MPQIPAKYDELAEVAAYVNWESLVAPYGFIKREAMLMSKNWMCNVWSWDHCFNALPLILGNRLPEDIRRKGIATLKSNKFMTSNGFATESPASSLYEDDGCWRGPIWAPSTFIIIDGLTECGEKEFATVMVERFCDMMSKSGCAENFDALTGEGLRDLAYTWTASVMFVLAHEYLMK